MSTWKKINDHDKWINSLLKWSVTSFKSNSTLEGKLGLYNSKSLSHGCRFFLSCTTVFLGLSQNKKVPMGSNVPSLDQRKLKILSKGSSPHLPFPHLLHSSPYRSVLSAPCIASVIQQILTLFQVSLSITRKWAEISQSRFQISKRMFNRYNSVSIPDPTNCSWERNTHCKHGKYSSYLLWGCGEQFSQK